MRGENESPSFDFLVTATTIVDLKSDVGKKAQGEIESGLKGLKVDTLIEHFHVRLHRYGKRMLIYKHYMLNKELNSVRFGLKSRGFLKGFF